MNSKINSSQTKRISFLTKVLIIILLGTFYIQHAQAQIKIGTNPNRIEKSSLLELESQSEGLLLPRLTDTVAINLLSPPSGMLIYLTKAPRVGLYVRKPTGWDFLNGSLNGINSVDTDKIQDGSVTTPKLADGAVSLAKQANIATASLLGRTSAGVGSPEVLSVLAAKTMLSLENVSNTSDGDKPLSSATQSALNFKANLASPIFTGTPTLPSGTIAVTQDPGNNTTAVATTAFVSAAAAAATPDADGTTKGKIQLAGDLTGTAAAPAIAASAVTTAKIANSAVSYAKIQNVSATNKVLGRVTAGEGVVEEIATTGIGDVVRAISPTVSSLTVSSGGAAITGNTVVTGAARNSLAYDAGTGTTIDFSQSNIAVTGATADAITLSNLQDGGAYTLIITGSATTENSFTAAGFTVRLMGTYPRMSGKHTIYSFIVVGTNVYVSMATEN